ncbi:MAG: tetratricopeptide repeat protein, partial [Opitutales bacterium]
MSLMPSAEGDLVFDREKSVRVEGGFLSRIFSGGGGGEKQAQLLIKKAEAALADNDYRDARSTYNKIAKRFPVEKVETGDGRKVYAAAEALYQTALLRERNSQWEKAFNALQKVIDKYPSYDFDKVIDAQIQIATKLGQGARTRIFRVIPGFRNLGKAREFHKKIAENARGPEYAPAALMKAAEIALGDNEQVEAIDSLER